MFTMFSVGIGPVSFHLQRVAESLDSFDHYANFSQLIVHAHISNALIYCI